MSFDRWGNRLYTGEKSYDIVGHRRTWYVVAGTVVLLSIVALLLRGGLNLGIDFTGGAEFRVSDIQGEVSELPATAAVQEVLSADPSQTSIIGDDSVRVRTELLTTAQTEEIASALAQSYDVPEANIASSFIGSTWGEEISQRALQGLLVFLVLVSVVIAVYFRTWKMAVAALAALFMDMMFTVGAYAATGLEVTPSTVIGFLTILGYSLYDTVVVFDKVRENTEEEMEDKEKTFGEAANLAVNQTLVRSINTSVVALLPIFSVLMVGLFLLGAGSLLDLSLVLFIGIAVGTFSSIFLATPLLVHLREREAPIVTQARRVTAARAGRPVDDGSVMVIEGPDDAELAAMDRLTIRDRQLGQRPQPKRPPRSRR